MVGISLVKITIWLDLHSLCSWPVELIMSSLSTLVIFLIILPFHSLLATFQVSISLIFDLFWSHCFFCTVQIKDSCIVDIENRRFYLLFLRLIWDFERDWLRQKVLYLVLMLLIVDLAQKWLREKTFYYPLLHFILDFARAAWLWEQIFYFSFLVFDRLRTPVTVDADVLSSLIVFCNWFCKTATAEADFLGSCRKYILPLISYVCCWRSTEIF